MQVFIRVTALRHSAVGADTSSGSTMLFTARPHAWGRKCTVFGRSDAGRKGAVRVGGREGNKQRGWPIRQRVSYEILKQTSGQHYQALLFTCRSSEAALSH